MTALYIYLLLGLLVVVCLLISSYTGNKRLSLGNVLFPILFYPLWPLLLISLWHMINKATKCAYCGQVAYTRKKEEMYRHILECQKHPMKRVYEAAESLLEETRMMDLPMGASIAECELSQAINDVKKIACLPNEEK